MLKRNNPFTSLLEEIYVGTQGSHFLSREFMLRHSNLLISSYQKLGYDISHFHELIFGHSFLFPLQRTLFLSFPLAKELDKATSLFSLSGPQVSLSRNNNNILISLHSSLIVSVFTQI